MQLFNETYFENIFYEYFDRVYSGFLKKTGEAYVAEELTQITFIKIWQYRDSFSFELPVLQQINRKAKQVFIDWLRKEAHLRKLASEIKPVTLDAVPSTELELKDRLQHSIDRLPAMRRRVFTMTYIEGFSHKEVAARLGISVKTVDVHVANALRDLRKYLSFFAVLLFISK